MRRRPWGVGVLIGLGLGTLQRAAQRRHERLQNEGRLSTGWAIMTGSMSRVAFLLIVLAVIQFVCPRLFVGGDRVVGAGRIGGRLWQDAGAAIA